MQSEFKFFLLSNILFQFEQKISSNRNASLLRLKGALFALFCQNVNKLDRQPAEYKMKPFFGILPFNLLIFSLYNCFSEGPPASRHCQLPLLRPARRGATIGLPQVFNLQSLAKFYLKSSAKDNSTANYKI